MTFNQWLGSGFRTSVVIRLWIFFEILLLLLLLLLIILNVVCFLLGKVADCSSFFQLCVKNVFTFSDIKDWKHAKFLNEGLFTWRWRTPDG